MPVGSYLIRTWCGFPCYTYTTHRRYGQPSDVSAKIECAEHLQPLRVVDWVGLAVRLAQESKEDARNEEYSLW